MLTSESETSITLCYNYFINKTVNADTLISNHWDRYCVHPINILYYTNIFSLFWSYRLLWDCAAARLSAAQSIQLMIILLNTHHKSNLKLQSF